MKWVIQVAVIVGFLFGWWVGGGGQIECIASLKDWRPTGTITSLLPGTRGVISCGRYQGSYKRTERPHSSVVSLPPFRGELSAPPSLSARLAFCFFFFSWLPCLKLTSTTNLISRLCSFETVTFGSSLTNRISFQRAVPLQMPQTPSGKVAQPVLNECVLLFNWLSTVGTACPCPSPHHFWLSLQGFADLWSLCC